MTQKKLLLTNILFWSALIMLAYFTENVVLFDLSNFQRGFGTIEYVLLFIGIIFILAHYFYLENKYRGLRVNWVLFAVLGVVFIGLVIGIFSTPDVQTFEAIEIVDGVETIVTKQFFVTLFDRIKSLFYALTAVIGVYLLVNVIPRIVNFRKYWMFCLYVIAGVALISCFISYFMDYDSYLFLFANGFIAADEAPASIFFNRNSYGLMLMLGILALYYLNSIKVRWFNYVFIVFLIINTAMTYCKTAILISVSTFGVFFIYRMVATFKYHKVRNGIFLGILSIIAVLIFLLLPLPFLMDLPLFSEIRQHLYRYYIEIGHESIGSRGIIWSNVFTLSEGVHLFFGRGPIIFNQALFFYNSQISVSREFTGFSHNGFVEILGQGGLIALIPYCLGLLAIVGFNIYMVFKNYRVGVPATIVTGAFLAYTMVETSTLFDLSIEGITTTCLVLLPSMSTFLRMRHPEQVERIIEEVETRTYPIVKLSYLDVGKRAADITGAIIALAIVGASVAFSGHYIGLSNYVASIITLIAIYLALPRMMANIFRSTNRGGFIAFAILISSFFAALVATAALPLGNTFLSFIGAKIVLISCIIVEFFAKPFDRPRHFFVKAYHDSLLPTSITLAFALLFAFLLPEYSLFIEGEIIALYFIVLVTLVAVVRSMRKADVDSRCSRRLNDVFINAVTKAMIAEEDATKRIAT